MGPMLCYAGFAVLAATAWLLLAGTAGWVPAEFADPWVPRGTTVGLAMVGLGLLLRLLAPVGRGLARGRCERCGAPTDLGQPLCRDHLKATLDAMRDRTRETLLRRTGPRGSG